MPLPLFVLLNGLAFMLGVLIVAATTRRILQRWEQRLTARGKGLEAARSYLARLGIELPAWVADIIDRERQARIAQRPTRRRRWWGWWQ